jgi:hypothetical protein
MWLTILWKLASRIRRHPDRIFFGQMSETHPLSCTPRANAGMSDKNMMIVAVLTTMESKGIEASYIFRLPHAEERISSNDRSET